MVDKIVPRYMYQKDGTYYFSRHVPNDVRHHYACDRIVICLKTSSEYAANNASKSIAGKLDDYWMKLKLSEMTVPAAHLLMIIENDISEWDDRTGNQYHFPSKSLKIQDIFDKTFLDA